MTTNDGTTIVADWSNVAGATTILGGIHRCHTDPVALVTITQDFDYLTPVAPASGTPSVTALDADFTIAGSCGDITIRPLTPDSLSVPCQRPSIRPCVAEHRTTPFTGFVDAHNRRVVDATGSAPDACTPI